MCKVHGVLAAALLSVLLLVAACKPETSIDDYPCPKEGTKLTYTSFGESYLAENCQICHGQASGDRKGAPAGFDFGTLDQVRQHKDRIFARAAADNVTMPPGPDDPPKEERFQLAEWLACGAP
jgi:uncharacterized membrane protein